MRTAGQAARITPASVPVWLKPRAYFQQILEAYRTWVMSCAADTADPVHAVLRSISSGGSQSAPGSPAGSYFPRWQDSFLSFVIGWLVWMGHTQWHDALSWIIGSDIQRTNGSSGWPRSHPTPYLENFEPGCQLAADLGADETTVEVDLPAGFPSDRFAISVGSPLHGNERRDLRLLYQGALAMAARLNVPGAPASFLWIDRQMRAALSPHYQIDRKWMVV